MSQASILILGATGQTGRRIARLLMARTPAGLILAARHRLQVESLAAELDRRSCRRVRAIALDAADAASLRGALAGVNLVVNATTAVGQARIMAEATLDAGADWIDIQFAPQQAAVLETMARRIEEAGRCFVIQGGFHPGLPAALVRFAAQRIESLETAAVAGLVRPEGGFPYTGGVDELIDAFRDYQAHVYHDGQWEKLRGGFGDLRRVDFAFGFGRQWTSPMDLDEMRRLPEMIPTLRSVGFSVAGFDFVTDLLVTPAIMLVLKLAPRARPRPLGKLFCWSTRIFGHPPYGALLQLDAAGSHAGRPARLQLSLFHADGYDLTAIPVVAMIEQLLDGSARRPGLHRMAHLLEPRRALADIEAMGVQVRLTAAPGEQRQ